MTKQIDPRDDLIDLIVFALIGGRSERYIGHITSEQRREIAAELADILLYNGVKGQPKFIATCDKCGKSITKGRRPRDDQPKYCASCAVDVRREANRNAARARRHRESESDG